MGEKKQTTGERIACNHVTTSIDELRANNTLSGCDAHCLAKAIDRAIKRATSKAVADALAERRRNH